MSLQEALSIESVDLFVRERDGDSSIYTVADE